MWYTEVGEVVRVPGGMTMSRLVSSVSPKGQVTIPAEIRKLLGGKPKDRVAFTVENNHVRIEPAPRATLDSVYRFLPALGQRLTDKERTRIAAEQHALHVAREGLD